jgi:hypothetical protein
MIKLKKDGAIKDFLSACQEWGEWTFMSPTYIREGCDMDWKNVEYPWWTGIAGFIRYWNVTFMWIGKCISREHGWCLWDDNHSFSWKWRIWYTLKCIACLILFRMRRGPGSYWDGVDVAAYDLGTDYFGEACGRLVRVGVGIVRGWYVENSSI